MSDAALHLFAPPRLTVERREHGVLVLRSDEPLVDPGEPAYGLLFDGRLADALVAHNAGAGSATRVERLLVLSEPPSLDAGEITDKGYVNQRALIERRATDVARPFAQPCPAGVIETAA
jgi:hypothetical protein